MWIGRFDMGAVLNVLRWSAPRSAVVCPGSYVFIVHVKFSGLCLWWFHFDVNVVSSKEKHILNQTALDTKNIWNTVLLLLPKLSKVEGEGEQ